MFNIFLSYATDRCLRWSPGEALRVYMLDTGCSCLEGKHMPH